MDLSPIIADLQRLQRKRSILLKSHNMQANRLRAIVAGLLGYRTDMAEKERTAKFKEAEALVQRVAKGQSEPGFEDLVRPHLLGLEPLEAAKKILEKEMEQRVSLLPVLPWVQAREQKGFGIPSLAIVVGEAGDLAGYANPAKLWKRFGCAPWTHEGQTLMGATWKSGRQGQLPAEGWKAFGYAPRRRSLAYVIGENLLRQNGVGPYRARYEITKARLQEAHPDYSALRCHRHGMLLATKLLLKNLWIQWRQTTPHV